ncbi:MAG: YhgE/Pip domain-containing protein [Arachnia sp.]
MRPESTHAGHRVSWSALMALILVPLLAVAALVTLGGNSNDDRVSAAVVNLDEAVQLDGQTVPLGRQLAAAMLERDGNNIGWTLADAKSAKDGLASGLYSAVVIIPREFSAAATSFSANDADKARQATVSVQVSDNAPVTDSLVAQEIARLAADTINSTLTESYLDNIYVGFNQVADQFTTIVDGAKQLSDGATKLADGTGKTSDGAAQLADGLGVLSKNSQPLVDGGGKLADGTDTLAQGASDLSTGASQLSAGVAEFAGQAPKLADGVNQLATGAKPLLGAIPGYTAGTKQAIGGVSQLKGGIDQVIAGLAVKTDTSQFDPLVKGSRDLAAGATQIDQGAKGISGGINAVDQQLQAFASGKVAPPEQARFQCPEGVDPTTCGMLEAAYNGGFQAGTGTASAALNTPDPKTTTSLKGGAVALAENTDGFATGAKNLADGIGQVPGQIEAGTKEQLGQLSAGLQKISDGAGTLVTQAQPLVDNADQLGDGSTQLLGGINQLNTQVAQLPGGVAQLASGSSQLAAGAGQLSDGAATLATGVEDYTSGVAQYTAGVDSAAKGMKQLSDGIVQLDDGAGKLSEGTSTFATELAKGADQVPTYSPEAREKLSTVVTSPVLQSDVLIDGGRAALVALILVAVLWLASLASFIVARAIPSDVLTSNESNAGLWGRTVGAPILITAVLGLVFGLIGGMVLGLPAGRVLGLMGLLAALGVAFTLVNHALTAWLGTVGRGISVLLLALSVALGLTSATPGIFDAIAGFSPVQNGLLLVRTWVSDGTGMAGLVGGVLLFAVVALILSVASVAGRRKLTPGQFRSRVAASQG